MDFILFLCLFKKKGNLLGERKMTHGRTENIGVICVSLRAFGHLDTLWNNYFCNLKLNYNWMKCWTFVHFDPSIVKVYQAGWWFRIIQIFLLLFFYQWLSSFFRILLRLMFYFLTLGRFQVMPYSFHFQNTDWSVSNWNAIFFITQPCFKLIYKFLPNLCVMSHVLHEIVLHCSLSYLRGLEK